MSKVRTIQQADVGSNAHYRVLDHNSNFVAKTYSLTEAHLIAAAPLLLEACEAAFDWMLECERETNKPMGEGLGYKGRMHKPVIAEKLRTSIAKATGGQP